MDNLNAGQIDIIAPNFKRRLSGVTATIVRLVPLQHATMAIAVVAPNLPPHVPHIKMRDVIAMSRNGPSGARVWHARRNSEMLVGIILKYILRKNLKLLFTSASQRDHTAYSKWLIGQMDTVISTSANTARYLKRPSTVILHGIDIEQFSPPANRAMIKSALNMPPGLLVGCFGRIRAQKGTDVFVDAMIHVLRDRPDVTAIVMGRATEGHRRFEKDLQAKVADHGMAHRIRFVPEVPVDAVADWYRALDLFIAPQRWEGFGLTPLEAMACGVPTIATRVGAFEELVIDGVTGALVPPGDVAAMTTAAAYYFDNPAERARRADAARAHITKNFPIAGEVAAINAIYKNLLEHHHPS